MFVGSFILYTLLYWDEPIPISNDDSFNPNPKDYLVGAILIFFALVTAVILALRLTKRILVPLDSLADGAKRIAAGDLSIRAIQCDHSLGEIAYLVDDFNEMATKLQNMVGDMTAWNAAIAHELRTPLTILMGRLQGISDGVFEPSEKMIQSLIFQVSGLSRIVEDLRIVTLQDSGHLVLHFEQARLSLHIQAIVESFHLQLKNAGLKVELNLIDSYINCDPVRVRQALVALLENAQKYARPGRLIITLFMLNNDAVLSVEDSGPGLDPNFVDDAFKPFSREDQSRQRILGGSGLGLSVVRAITLAHGGNVKYRRSFDGGSVFEIVIPHKPS